MNLHETDGGGRADRPRGAGSKWPVFWLILLLGLAAGLVTWWTRSPEANRQPPDVRQLQGEPILPLNTHPAALGPVSNRFGFAPGTMTNLTDLASSNAVLAEVTGLGEAQKSARRRRSKPGSYPKRMMDFQMRLLAEGKDPRDYDTNLLPADFVLTNLPPPEIEGYHPVSFGLLAGYEFALQPEVVQASTNTQATDPAIALVPPEVRALNGRQVAISGFLLPMRMDEGLAVEFLLMRDQTLCCFGRVPRINEWISVRALGRGARPRMDTPITVCGSLTVAAQREKGTLIGLYQMTAEKIMQPE